MTMKVLRRVACAGLILSMACRVAQDDSSAARRYFYEDIFIPFFAKEDGGRRYRNQRPGSSVSRFAARKEPGSIRIFVVGGSIAQRYMSGGDGKSTLQEHLGPALRGARIEAFNCGMSGYDSDRESMIVEEILEYSPDAVVLMSGHNERLSSGYWPIPPLWILHAADRIQRLGVFKKTVGRIEQAQPRSRRDSDMKGAHFAENIREIIRRSKARGTPVVLVLPPINYRDSAPHNHAAQNDPRFIAGMAHYLRGGAARARRIWSGMLEEYGRSENFGGEQVILFYVARAAEKLRDFSAADLNYQRIADTDVAAPFCASECQNIIRRTAKEEGAPLIDLDGAFRRISAPRLPGLEMFNDSVHWDRRYDGVLSEEIAAVLRAQRGLSRLSWDEKRLSSLGSVSWSARGDEDEARATLRYAASKLKEEKGAGEENPAIKALAYIERVHDWYPDWFLDNDALLRELETVDSKGMAWGMPPLSVPRPNWYWHVGQVLLSKGKNQQAAALFSRAAQLDPKMPGVFISRAAAEAFLGDFEGARKDLENAERLGAPGRTVAAWKEALLSK